MKINQINTSFKGIKNIGYTMNNANVVFQNSLQTDESMDFADNYNGTKPSNSTLRLINMQFTDDFKGKHLTEYKKIMKDYPEYHNKVNNQFLNFIHMSNDKESFFVVNNRILPIKDENLKLLSFIARTIKEISKKNTKDFIVNNDYFQSEDFSQGFMLNFDLSMICPEQYLNQLGHSFHKPENVKSGAKNMMDDMTKVMLNYFEN